VERDALPEAGEREWYEADLVGLPAVGRDGRDWGKVIAFHDFGAGPVMEVSGGIMLPFTDETVPEIDVEGGKVVVDPPAGLLAETVLPATRQIRWRFAAIFAAPAAASRPRRFRAKPRRARPAARRCGCARSSIF